MWRGFMRPPVWWLPAGGANTVARRRGGGGAGGDRPRRGRRGGGEEPRGGGGEHEEADEQAAGVKQVAEGAGEDGESGVDAFACAGDEHEDHVGEDGEVPGVEGPGAVEDPGSFAEELGQDEEQQR